METGWCRVTGSKKEALQGLNRRYGLTRHAVWLAETPTGPAVIALHEGPGGDDFMAKIGLSQHADDLWLKEKLMEFHGVDVSQPPSGPLPEKYLDIGT